MRNPLFMFFDGPELQENPDWFKWTEDRRWYAMLVATVVGYGLAMFLAGWYFGHAMAVEDRTLEVMKSLEDLARAPQ